MQSFRSFLTEQKYPKMYHGTPNEFEFFDAGKLGQGADQYGPGFYFTDDYDTAAGYADGDGRYGKPQQRGVVFECTLTIRKPIPGDKKLDRRIAEKLLLAAEGVSTRQELETKFEEDPDSYWDSPLSNWYEDPLTSFDALLESVMAYDNAQQSMQTIWYDGYGANNKRYMEEAVKAGYDGVVLNNINGTDVTFIICFNSSNIEIHQKIKV